jgi:hypothetical protein
VEIALQLRSNAQRKTEQGDDLKTASLVAWLLQRKREQ